MPFPNMAKRKTVRTIQKVFLACSSVCAGSPKKSNRIRVNSWAWTIGVHQQAQQHNPQAHLSLQHPQSPCRHWPRGANLILVSDPSSPRNWGCCGGCCCCCPCGATMDSASTVKNVSGRAVATGNSKVCPSFTPPSGAMTARVTYEQVAEPKEDRHC